MANKTLTDLYSDNPITVPTDNDLFETEQSGVSGAIKKSDLLAGAGSLQLPAWTYTAGAIGTGLFITSTTDIASTTQITFETQDYDTQQSFVSIVAGSRLCLTASGGIPYFFSVNTVTQLGSGNVLIAVGASLYGGNWSGRYTVSFIPAAQSAALVGLGNVTNDAQLKASDLDTDGTLAGDSDSKVPSQKAVKTYADTKGDMVKAIYDPQNVGMISGLTTGAGTGGVLSMVGTIANAGSINLDGGTGSGGSIGGSIITTGLSGPGGSINTGGGTTGNKGGDILTYGGTQSSCPGGNIDTHSEAQAGGSITTCAGPGMTGGPGGSINTSGASSSSFAGGSIDLSGGSNKEGGSIDTHDGGGSINTRGTGSIGLGELGTRTSLTGTATADRAIALPDADGTLLLNDGNASALTGLTQTQILAALGVTANAAGFATFLAIFGITPAADGAVTPVTTITTTSGIPTSIT